MFEERKSIRKYKPDMIPDDVLQTILEAGRVAPSAKNRQPWRFIVLSGTPKEEALKEMEKGIEKQKNSLFMPKKFKRGLVSAENTLRIMREAPVIIMVLNANSGNPYLPTFAGFRVSEILDSLSIGAAIENMLLAATNLGIGSLWIGNTVYSHKELIRYLGTKHQLAGAVALGYANEEPAGRPKKTLDELVEYRRG